jgi:hypothetical protein
LATIIGAHAGGVNCEWSITGSGSGKKGIVYRRIISVGVCGHAVFMGTFSPDKCCKKTTLFGPISGIFLWFFARFW